MWTCGVEASWDASLLIPRLEHGVCNTCINSYILLPFNRDFATEASMKFLRPLLAPLLLLGLWSVPPAAAAELIILERPGCAWCLRWERSEERRVGNVCVSPVSFRWLP